MVWERTIWEAIGDFCIHQDKQARLRCGRFAERPSGRDKARDVRRLWPTRDAQFLRSRFDLLKSMCTVSGAHVDGPLLERYAQVAA
jgi:hypothetical protein